MPHTCTFYCEGDIHAFPMTRSKDDGPQPLNTYTSILRPSWKVVGYRPARETTPEHWLQFMKETWIPGPECPLKSVKLTPWEEGDVPYLLLLRFSQPA